jgi:carbonic anhydrase
MAAVLVVAAVVLGLLLIGGIVVLSRRYEERRTASLTAAADRLGWGFRKDVAFDAVPGLDRFELFRLGHSKKLRNLMTSPPGATRAVLFEYAYTTGGGKSQATYRQTVFYATSDQLHLPVFSLRPENFFHRVAGAFGYQDIDLEARPEFSRMFLLRGEEEDGVREAFSEGVAEFFETRPRVCAAGVGRELLYWRPNRVAKAEELEELIAEGHELAARLAAAAHRPS